MQQDFTLPITTGGEFTFSQLNKPLVLFFYPRDNTPGCTVENQDFSRLYPEFKAAGFEVLGISRDKHVTHCNFQKKHTLQHQLLADPEETVCNLFNVMRDKTMYGKAVRGIERSTFVFDEKRNLIQEWHKVKVEGHAQGVLDFVKAHASA